jgi:hypothetical protein
MNARAEAEARVARRYEVRVLEPSPPAVTTPPWFADDPTAPGARDRTRQLVSPVPGGDLRWTDLAAEDEELASWCAERWLGPYRRLAPPPSRLVQTRLALHRLAERVIMPSRRQANGKIGLRYTRGGFGTPFFGQDTQIRVEGRALIVDEQGSERRAPVTTLAAAADHIGRHLLPAELALDDAVLDVEEDAAAFLGDWFGFAASVLEELRAEAPSVVDPSRVQLWPEHFDLAVELGSQAESRRAAYGLSPGDDLHPEPYAYVAPWEAPPEGELWQATAFTGAELSYSELLAAEDQRDAALRFFRARLAALNTR